MLAALVSFLGGSVFRMVWGEVSNFVNKRQDHTFEIERLKLQSDMDDRAHQRTQEAIRLQSELGVKTIEAQAESNVLTAEADAFTEAMKNALTPTGIYGVDTLSGQQRPLLP
jgi:S-formylglutathione hydrolase FrmB